MAVPYLIFSPVTVRSFEYKCSDNSPDSQADWVDSAQKIGRLGEANGGVAPKYSGWRTIARPSRGWLKDAANLGHIIDYRLRTRFWNVGNTQNQSTVQINYGILNHSASVAWVDDEATGQYAKTGVVWDAFPPFVGSDSGAYLPSRAISGFGIGVDLWGCSYRSGVGPAAYQYQDLMWQNGFFFAATNFSPNPSPPDDGKLCEFLIEVDQVIVRFHNPVVNSLSISKMNEQGGVALVLTGLGFDNDESEITNATNNPTSLTPPGGWRDGVSEIIFEGQGGQGNYSLIVGPGDFTVDSNTQITIPSMPAMKAGAYLIKLRKTGAIYNVLGDYPSAYAGAWRAETDGRLYADNRLVFFVGDHGGRVVLTKWTFKRGDTTIDKYYAPIDAASPLIFYDGRILTFSSVKRGISNAAGLFQGSDMNLTLSNADLEFSKLLAQYYLKNQIVELYYGWAEGPEGWKSLTSRLVADSYSIIGPEFGATLRDISISYFKRKVPLYRCTADEYPNIYPAHLNRPKPEILGDCFYTSDANEKGAVEAVYIDTTTFQYLAARGSLYSIPAVYSAGILVPPSNYSITYGNSGETLITFNSSQGENKITFDAKGYVYAPWVSANGFVQNPAYILGFFFAFLCEVPIDFLVLESFDDLAAMFDALGKSTIGKLIIQNENDAEEYLKQLLFTFGALAAFDRLGRWRIDRKDISVISTATRLWSQIDLLNHPTRDFNLASAFNLVRARWDYSPSFDAYIGGQIFSRQSSIDDFGGTFEPASPFDFPWTTDAAWVESRCLEELIRYGYGASIFTFELPLDFYDDLDLLDDFRLQDPFGLDVLGNGEIGRYLYIDSIDADFQNRKMTVVANDLSYILRQYIFYGDEAEIPENWANATEEQRLWAFYCNESTWRFSDDEPGKYYINENL